MLDIFNKNNVIHFNDDRKMTQVIPKVKHIAVFLFVTLTGSFYLFLIRRTSTIFFLVLFILLKFLHGIEVNSSDENKNDATRDLKFPEDVQHATIMLNDAYRKIEALEEKIISLEGRVPKTYPDVRFLNYLQRKRILVNTNVL